MSENDPTPSKQTSSIPLKKETVRVTLKAADAPPASPGGAAPTAPAVRPPTPTAPAAPTVRTAPPAPTAAMTGGAPRPAPAATIPLKTAPGAGIPKPAPTIPLKSGPVGSATAPAARPSLPGAPAGGSTVSLPKATVQLAPPSAPASATFPVGYGSGLEEEEEVQESGLANILSIVGFVAALVVLYFQFDTASAWVNAPDNEKTGWGQLFE